MKANKLTNVCSWASKFTMTCALAFSSFSYVQAQQVEPQEVLGFEQKDVIVGQDNTLSLMLNNGTQSVSAMDFVFYLPNYVQLSTPKKPLGSFVPNNERITDNFEVTVIPWEPKAMSQKKYGPQPPRPSSDFRAYKVKILPSFDPMGIPHFLNGSSAKIADLKIYVSPEFLNLPEEFRNISLEEITISDDAGNALFVDNNNQVNVKPYQISAPAGTLTVADSQMEVYNGQPATVAVNMGNYIPLGGLQFDVEFPNADFVFDPASIKVDSRLAGFNVRASELPERPNVWRFVIYSNTSKRLAPGNSSLLTFNFTPSASTTAVESEIKFSNVLFSDVPRGHEEDVNSHVYDIVKVPSIKVVNVTFDSAEAHQVLRNAVKAYQDLFNNACAKVNDGDMVAEKEAAAKAIEALNKDVEAMQHVNPQSVLNPELKNAVELALCELTYPIFISQLDALVDAKNATIAKDTQFDAHKDVYSQLDKEISGIRNDVDLSYTSRKADFANRDKVAIYNSRFDAAESKLNTLAAETNGAEFDKVFTEVKDNVSSVVLDKDLYIAEDMDLNDPTSLASQLKALQDQCNSLDSKHNALLDYDQVNQMNAAAAELIKNSEEFIARPGIFYDAATAQKPDARDLNALIDCILDPSFVDGSSSASKRQFKRANVNGGMDVNAMDINAIIDMILGE